MAFAIFSRFPGGIFLQNSDMWIHDHAAFVAARNKSIRLFIRSGAGIFLTCRWQKHGQHSWMLVGKVWKMKRDGAEG